VLRRAAVLVAGPLLLAAAAAAEQDPPPRLALVLSGGGARGAAHIGVLEVLEELHVVPDLVVGTSMGSIVGGLYAAGWSPGEIAELLGSVDWSYVFSDSVRRYDRSFRRRQDDRPYLLHTKLRFRGWRPYVPPGVLGGQSLELLLRSLEIRSAPPTDFDRFPIPFRAVAMDVATGDPVVIGSGSLAVAMRASMAIPGAFAPVELDGRRLVDGGGAANLPVGVAQSLGATRVIAVDVSTPLTREGESFTDFVSVFNQLNNLLTASNRSRDVARLRPGDVLLVPELGDIGFADFPRAAEAVAIGERSAREREDALRALAAGEERRRELELRHRRPPESELVVDRVRLENSSRVSDEVVRRALDLEPGVRAEDALLRRALLRLHSLDYFGTVRDRLERAPDGARELVVTTPPPPHGRNRAQVGIALANDFRGDTRYALLLRHQLLAASPKGGEWENEVQLGDALALASEFYQPLDNGMRWFVQPAASWRRRPQVLWVDGRAVAEYRMRTAAARLDVGRVLGRWGEVRAGAILASDRGETRIGPSLFPDRTARRGAAEVQLRVDTVSSIAFPRGGADVTLRYTRSSRQLGSDVDLEQVYLHAMRAWSVGEHTVAPYVEYAENLRSPRTVFALFPLGGRERLSGLGEGELLGEKVAYAQLAYYRRLRRLDLAGLHLRVYAGAALEAGDAVARDEPLAVGALRAGWSVFVGADTPLGPVYLGWGTTDGRGRVHVAVGGRI